MLKYIRSHWSIENNLHWQLDVTFGEDKSRLRTLFSPFNMNIARKAALSFLKKDSTNNLFKPNASIQSKRFIFLADNRLFKSFLKAD